MDIMGVLFPRRCPVCDGILRLGKEKICPECKGKLVYIREPRCKKCGKQIEKMEQEYCFDCKKHNHFYEMGIAPFSHAGAVRKSIYAIKYQNKREYLDFYTDEIARLYREEIKEWDCDGLIPVPLHKRKRLKRGYNQAEVMAKKLAKKLELPVYRDGLIRIVDTKPQKELNDIQRKKNLEKAFIMNENIVKLRKVILIDDIYTTGSTIDACTKVLMEHGVKKVYFICISVGTGY